MSILTQYILKKYLTSFLIILISLEIFIVGIDFLQSYKNLPKSANLQLLYLFYNSFFTFTLILPLTLVFSWVLTLIILIKNNELVAFLSLGVKPSTVYLPVITISLILLFFLIGLQMTPLAYSDDNKRRIYHNEYFINYKEDIFVKYNNNFIYLKKIFPLEKKAEGIRIYILNNDDIEEVISAQKAYFKNNRWYVIDAKIIKKPHNLDWDQSKLKISYENFLYTLEGFKPKVLDNTYGQKSNYGIIDALYAFWILNKQGINTNNIRSSLYYQIFIPFFILPMIILIFKNSAINSRFFKLGQFANFGIFGTIVIWGIFFMLHKFASGGIVLPEFALLLPIVLFYILIPYIIKKYFINSAV